MNQNEDLSVTRTEALELLLENWPLNAGTELIPLQQALGRVTAKDVYSQNTLPVCRVSQADGIAVRSADFSNGLPDTFGWSKGVEFVQADTGDDFPDDYDTIIPVENIYFDNDGKLHFADGFSFSKGDRVRKAGSLLKEGDLLAEAHACLTPVHLAVFASGGIYQLEVLKKPKVVFIPTGSELITAGIKPERGQNVESNGLMVSALLQQWGAEPICYPIIKDKPTELEQALNMALAAADIVLINGGSSKGAEDFNADLLQKRASIFRHGIKAIPGKPVAVAIIDGKPVINLPGPIMAAFLAMDWCVSRLVHHYYGLSAPARPKIKVKLEESLQKPSDFERFFRLVLTKKDGSYMASPIEFDKNLPYTMLKADAILIAPIGIEGYQAGDEVEAELLCSMEEISSVSGPTYKLTWGEQGAKGCC